MRVRNAADVKSPCDEDALEREEALSSRSETPCPSAGWTTMLMLAGETALHPVADLVNELVASDARNPLTAARRMAADHLLLID
jgi:hypothetical protein